MLLGLGAVGVWIVLLANGALDGGLDRQIGDNYVAFRFATDLAVGIVAIAAGFGLLAKRDWARPATFVALGGIMFAALSALAWTIELSVWLSLVAVAGGLAALWAARQLAWESGRVYRALRMLPSPMESILDHEELGPHFAEELARMIGKS